MQTMTHPRVKRRAVFLFIRDQIQSLGRNVDYGVQSREITEQTRLMTPGLHRLYQAAVVKAVIEFDLQVRDGAPQQQDFSLDNPVAIGDDLDRFDLV